MLQFTEDFRLYDENYVPYGIEIESATKLFHRHIRPVANGMAIAACGNKYFLKAPRLAEYEAALSFSFDYVTDFAGAILYLDYEPIGRAGYALYIEWHGAQKSIRYTLKTLAEDRTVATQVQRGEADFFPESGVLCRAHLSADKNGLTLRVNGAEAVTFAVPVRGGRFGFGRPDFVGEIVYHSASISVDAEAATLLAPVQVQIPMEEGGTMPLSVTYEIFDLKGTQYLKATLDGGPQYRSQYKYYDPEGTRGQYSEEIWLIERPYIRFGEKKFHYSMGSLNTAPPLYWKGILDKYLGIVELPVTLTVCVEDAKKETVLGFGYEKFCVRGFASQSGRAEYLFSVSGEYLGKTVFPDSFALQSPRDKQAVSMIGDGVYEAEAVRDHFARGHYFAEGEEILFTLIKSTDKKYLTYETELQDAFGDTLCALTLKEDRITHAPLPVGVYRIALRVFYGGEVLSEQSTVFEVYDPTGKRCAPIEAGLPVLFSTPNEQKYLDRDKFDPWNPGAPANSEHFYAISCFAGYVGERKRIWEVIKTFGRKWYAWLNSRTYGDAEGYDYKKHTEVVKNSDFLAYPTKYARTPSTRFDHMAKYFWDGRPEMLGLLDAFLDERAEENARERVGYKRGGKMTQACIDNLYKYYKDPWYAYAHQAFREGVLEQNRTFAAYNPDWKRSYYGPVCIYAAMLRSYPLSRNCGLDISDYLSDTLYTGFCQLEDYPAACAYQTLRGPFAVGPFLAKVPKLVIYPEQYPSANGGCIDGHVKFANPPLGKYEIPLWYSTTHAREFVYNTAVKTETGYRFWDTYGFMHRDFDEEADDAFIRDWKYVRDHKPRAVKRSPIFFAEFPAEEDFYETEFVPDGEMHIVYNPSEEGVGHFYEVMRLHGLPMGAFAAWDALDTLTKEDTDLLILPSTAALSAERLEKIRRLYNEGVSLLAVSRVDGLEDIFGVSYAPSEHKMLSLEADGRTETIYPYTERFLYRASGAEVLMTASGRPVLFRNGRAALLNLPACSVGRIHFKEHPYLGRATDSPLFYEVSERLVRALTSPLAESDRGAGITLLEDEDGRDLLLVIDYSRHEQSEISMEREYTVWLRCRYSDAACLDKKRMRRLFSEDGGLDGIVITLRRHESALIHLIP